MLSSKYVHYIVFLCYYILNKMKSNHSIQIQNWQTGVIKNRLFIARSICDNEKLQTNIKRSIFHFLSYDSWTKELVLNGFHQFRHKHIISILSERKRWTYFDLCIWEIDGNHPGSGNVTYNNKNDVGATT